MLDSELCAKLWKNVNRYNIHFVYNENLFKVFSSSLSFQDFDPAACRINLKTPKTEGG